MILKTLAAIAFLVLLAPQASAETTVTVGPFEAVPVVTDADTLKFGKIRVRLFGIDAPEKNQCCTKPDGTKLSCGYLAKDMLTKFLKDKPVHCDIVMQDTRWHRPVGVCRLVSSGLDLNALIVKGGLAVAAPQYSTDYVDEQRFAEDHKSFLWGMKLENPADWRKRREHDPKSVEICKAPK